MDLGSHGVIGLDTETTGLVYPIHKAYGVSISTPSGQDWYFDIRRDHERREVQDTLRSYKNKIVCHNATFDYSMLLASGIESTIEQYDCTVIRACQINEHEGTIFPWTRRPGSYALDDLMKKYLKKKKVDDLWEKLAAIFGGKPTRKAQIVNMQHAPKEFVHEYAVTDSRGCLDLWLWQETEIEKQGIEDIIEFERSLIPTITRRRVHGIRVDPEYCGEAIQRLDPVIKEEQRALDSATGRSGFNVNSTPQVRALFNPREVDGHWFAEDGTPLGTTKTGNPSISKEYLNEIKDPRALMIADHRSLLKTRDTFLKKHVLEHMHNGRVFPSIKQTAGEDGGTRTGRLAIADPAMQQIPTRNKAVAEIVKQCFLPDEGQVWVDTDLDGFEVRVFAHCVSLYDSSVADSYADNPDLDLHQWVADITGLPRDAQKDGGPYAKQLNLSMIFNSGNGAIADKMGLPWTWDAFKNKETGEWIDFKRAGPEAMQVINHYHRKMPGVKLLAKRARTIAENRGYIKTMYGRRLRFPRGFKSYKASGLLIQATSADINKENWQIIEDTLEGTGGNLLLNTHDSYSLSLPEDWKPIYDQVKSEIERDVLRVPLVLSLSGAGKNWWEAVKKE